MIYRNSIPKFLVRGQFLICLVFLAIAELGPQHSPHLAQDLSRAAVSTAPSGMNTVRSCQVSPSGSHSPHHLDGVAHQLAG